MPVVTLTTDFGSKDYFVGALKGELLKLYSNLTIVDVSHHIKPFNITEASFVLKNAYPSFPEGSVHVVTVNDQDDRIARYIAAEYEKHFFIGMDNGLFNMIFNHPPDGIAELPAFMMNGTLTTYPGKKIFAKAACELALGKKIGELGKPVAELTKRLGLEPVVQESLIRGTVIHIDSFQNVIVNITRELFSRVRGKRDFSISYRSKRTEAIDTISESYYDVPQGYRLCLFNSSGYLEIAIHCGEAGSLLGLKVGDYVQIDFQ